MLPIVLYPNDVLKMPAAPVTAFDAGLHALLDGMAEAMYAADGIGLAGNQVAALQRVCVIDLGNEAPNLGLLELINPRIVSHEGQLVWNEGCLSIPELYHNVRRSARVDVEYQDRHGNQKQLRGEDLLAVALQHELDHLDGVLFLDRLGALDKRLAIKKYQRLRKQATRGSGANA